MFFPKVEGTNNSHILWIGNHFLMMTYIVEIVHPTMREYRFLFNRHIDISQCRTNSIKFFRAV